MEAAELAGPAARRARLLAGRNGPGWRRPSATRSRLRRRPGAWSFAAEVQQATRDSVRALMLIRAYRIRGHLHAKLDPLGLEPEATTRSSIRAPTASPRPTTTARSSSTTCSASNSPRCARSSPSCQRTYCQTLGVEFMHISDPARRPGSRSASRAPTRRSPSPARASARSSTSWSKPKASRSSAT